MEWLIILVAVGVACVIYLSNKRQYRYHTFTANGTRYKVKIDVSPKAIKEYQDNQNAVNTTPVSQGNTRLSIKDFLQTYERFLSWEQISDVSTREFKGFTFIDVPDNVLKGLEEKRQQEAVRHKHEETMSGYWRKALQAEKEHDYAAAISYWEQVLNQVKVYNPPFGQYGYALERLMIHYRRFKRYADEIKICEYAIDHDNCTKRINRYKERLTKAQTLYKKQLNNNNNE